jgi:hypothetical protein
MTAMEQSDETRADQNHGRQNGTGGPECSTDSRPPHALEYGEYDESGVDVSLLRYMLALSPLERLQRMEAHARDTQILLKYGRRHREAKAAANR